MYDEVKDLNSLAAYADLGLQLQRCQFFDDEVTKLQLTISGKNTTANLASDEHLRAWLLPIRQMLSSGEPTYYRHVHKILSRHAPHELAMRHAISLKEQADRQLSTWFPTHTPPFPESPEELIKHFFNGEYFHDKTSNKSKPHREAIERWYKDVGFEKTHWEYQNKLLNVGMALFQHAHSAVAASRFLLSKIDKKVDLVISDDCARLLGVMRGRSTVSRNPQYEDDIVYSDRFKRVLSGNGYGQLKTLFEAGDLTKFASCVAPEKPLSIESILNDNKKSWTETESIDCNNTVHVGCVTNRDFGRLSGSWSHSTSGTFEFSGDAVLLLNISLAECRSFAARPRNLARRIEYMKTALQITDQWFWEVQTIDDQKQYVKYQSADFNQLGI